MFSCKRCASLSLAAVVICSAIGLLVVSSRHAQGDDANRVREPSAQQAADESTQSSAIQLQGKGRQASDKFQLQPGVANFEVAHDGKSNVIIRLLDDNGKEVDTVFNQIGPFQGDRSVRIGKAIRGLLDVAADGNWSVTIRQPEPADVPAAPVSLQGTGYHATSFVQLHKGLTVCKLTHDGESRFVVTLLDQYGNPVGNLINVLGKFDGSKPIRIEEPGIYYFNVSAEGTWTIDVE